MDDGFVNKPSKLFNSCRLSLEASALIIQLLTLRFEEREMRRRESVTIFPSLLNYLIHYVLIPLLEIFNNTILLRDMPSQLLIQLDNTIGLMLIASVNLKNLTKVSECGFISTLTR